MQRCRTLRALVAGVFLTIAPMAVFAQTVGVGSMFDSNGKNMTEQPLASAPAGTMSAAILAQLEASTWVRDGKSSAPRTIYAFTDPNCPYCQKFWVQSRPWVDSGKVQIRNIIVGILRDTSPGKAAAILTASNPSDALNMNESTMSQGGIAPLTSIPAATGAQLQANQDLMTRLGADGTPTIFYQDAQGVLRAKVGAPSDNELTTILGNR
jgi:thiol:disulfide interchange protein DsbG